MGLLRFILAISVVFAHSPIGGESWRPLIDADLAVEIFFVMSGFYMGLVLSTKYDPRSSAGRTRFWLARFVRIYPAYWVMLAAVGLFWVCFYHYGVKQFFEVPAAVSSWAAVSNLLLFGLDGLLFVSNFDGVVALRATLSDGTGVQPHHLIAIAPAWTLSLELMFYALAPWLVRLKSKWLVIIVALSLLLRVVLWALGLASDPWTYRFFPTELGLFVLGMLSYRAYSTGLLTRTSAATIALFTTIFLFPLLPDGPEVFGRDLYGIVAVMLSPAALPWLFARAKDVRWDRIIGDLSFPVYLAHLPVMIYLRHFWHGDPDPLLFTGATVLSTLVVAAVLEHVAVPLLLATYRRRLRFSAA